MGRIEGLREDSAPLVTRFSYRQARRQLGKLPEPFAVTAHHTKLMLGYAGLELALDKADKVDDKLKALAETKAACLVGCEFCIDIGSMISRKAGVTKAQLQELADFRDSDFFSPLEKLVLEYAEGMTRTPVEVSDELFARMREQFDEEQLVELTAAVAIENYRARFNDAFGLGSQGFTRDGEACAVQHT